MKRTLPLLVLLALPATAAAAPPPSKTTTIQGDGRSLQEGETYMFRRALPSDQLYGMQNGTPGTVFLDYFWDQNLPATSAKIIARVCRRSYKGTRVCGPDAEDVNPPDETFRTLMLSAAGIAQPNVTSQWDSYVVEIEYEIVRPDGGISFSNDTRVLGVGWSYGSGGASTLRASNTFTVHDAAFGLEGTPDSYGRQRMRASLPHDSVYGFINSTAPTMYVDFGTATDVPFFTSAPVPRNPIFEPVNYANYDIDYDAKACRQSWTGSTAVCGPDVNRHNPYPGTTTYLSPSTAAITSPSNSTFDYYYVEVMAGITEDWTSGEYSDFYDARNLFRDWRYEDEGRIYATSVVHHTSLSDFPSTSRPNVLFPQHRRSDRFDVHNDTIYGFKASSTGSFFLDYYVAAYTGGGPAHIQYDLAARLCRETFTGSTVVCAPDSTKIHTTFNTWSSFSLSTAGLPSPTNSVWDYYYGSVDELHHRADGSTVVGFAVDLLGLSARYFL